MGRLFLVEYNSDEPILVCCVCATHIALLTNFIDQEDFLYWPVSQGQIFSSTVNLFDPRTRGNEDYDESPLFGVRVYCVKCGLFFGYTQYYIYDLSQPCRTLIFAGQLDHLIEE